MCTDKNNDENKRNFPPPLFHRITEKLLLTTKSLKFSDFQFVL